LQCKYAQAYRTFQTSQPALKTARVRTYNLWRRTVSPSSFTLKPGREQCKEEIHSPHKHFAENILIQPIDRESLKNRRFHDNLFGKIFAARGYVSQDVFEKLFIDGIHLITRLKKNMKNSLMSVRDKIYLRKHSLIETVNDELKNICQIEHTRHRCFEHFIGNIVSALIAYNFLPKKPSLNLDIIDISDLKWMP
jgi:hypothetical protein